MSNNVSKHLVSGGRRTITLKGEPARPKRWSHQDELVALRGKWVQVRVRDQNEPLEGILVETDQFTIKLMTERFFFRRDGSSVNTTPAPHILFKSALVSIGSAE